jgi:hypothetical protein
MTTADIESRPMTTPDTFAAMVACELAKAQETFAPFNSAHEAYAVILEEVEELWEEVRHKHKRQAMMCAELVQIAAMCQRAAEDLGLCPKEPTE